MTQISYMSDLHLEAGGLPDHFDLGRGGLLVLAGDIVPAASLLDGGEVSKAATAFFEDAAARYDRVIYVAGNHEFYRTDITNAEAIIRRKMPANVVFLADEWIDADGLPIFGATFWTDFNLRGEPEFSKSYAHRFMRDYEVIRNIGEQHPATRPMPRLLLPEDTQRMHRNSIDALTSRPLDVPALVVTHHPPVKTADELKNQRSSPLSPAFVSDRSDLVKTLPAGFVWICGHTHTRFSQMVGGVTVCAAPRGYPREQIAVLDSDGSKREVAPPLTSPLQVEIQPSARSAA